MTVTAQAPRISDQTLGRLLKWGSALFVVLLVAFAVFYTLSQRVSTGPSVLERQISAAESAVQATPKNLPARLALAQAYRASGRTDDALAQYSEVLRVDKANMDALLGRGQTSLEAGKLDEAAAVQGADPRTYLIQTKKFVGGAESGHLKELHTVNIEWAKNEKGQFIPKEIPGTEKVWPAQLVLLAMARACRLPRTLRPSWYWARAWKLRCPMSL